jgi:hypothetical protein
VFEQFLKFLFFILLSSFCLAMASLRKCSRCGDEHEPPVGKKCKWALQTLPDAQAARTVDTVLDDAGDQVTGGVEDHVSSLVSVISQLVTRLDSQQEQLNHLQAAVASSSPVASRPLEVTQGQSAIPKRSCAQEAFSVPVDNITLPDLRADGAAMSQAIRMVDSLDTGMQGNSGSAMNFPKTLKRGWARPGGENAPRIPIPWPQDFIIGQGRKSWLLFDELDIHQCRVQFL